MLLVSLLLYLLFLHIYDPHVYVILNSNAQYLKINFYIFLLFNQHFNFIYLIILKMFYHLYNWRLILLMDTLNQNLHYNITFFIYKLHFSKTFILHIFLVSSHYFSLNSIIFYNNSGRCIHLHLHQLIIMHMY